MMGRIARVVAVGCLHHVTQRGNFRRDVFFDDEDRQTYLELLGEGAAEAQVRIWDYCLLSKHVPLIVVPEMADSMAVGFRVAHGNYSHWLNILLRRVGHVWQNRPFPPRFEPARALSIRLMLRTPCAVWSSTRSVRRCLLLCWTPHGRVPGHTPEPRRRRIGSP